MNSGKKSGVIIGTSKHMLMFANDNKVHNVDDLIQAVFELNRKIYASGALHLLISEHKWRRLEVSRDLLNWFQREGVS